MFLHFRVAGEPRGPVACLSRTNDSGVSNNKDDSEVTDPVVVEG